ncbi:MAG: hypothetical protein ACW972_01740 [Promethearchaeota archaeon]
MKIYCPECSQEIDETEFMQYKGLCAMCYENNQNPIQEKDLIKKGKIFP